MPIREATILSGKNLDWPSYSNFLPVKYATNLPPMWTILYLSEMGEISCPKITVDRCVMDVIVEEQIEIKLK